MPPFAAHIIAAPMIPSNMRPPSDDRKFCRMSWFKAAPDRGNEPEAVRAKVVLLDFCAASGAGFRSASRALSGGKAFTAAECAFLTPGLPTQAAIWGCISLLISFGSNLVNDCILDRMAAATAMTACEALNRVIFCRGYGDRARPGGVIGACALPLAGITYCLGYRLGNSIWSDLGSCLYAAVLIPLHPVGSLKVGPMIRRRHCGVCMFPSSTARRKLRRLWLIFIVLIWQMRDVGLDGVRSAPA